MIYIYVYMFGLSKTKAPQQPVIKNIILLTDLI